jgi:hypothetical protein
MYLSISGGGTTTPICPFTGISCSNSPAKIFGTSAAFRVETRQNAARGWWSFIKPAEGCPPAVKNSSGNPAFLLQIQGPGKQARGRIG